MKWLRTLYAGLVLVLALVGSGAYAANELLTFDNEGLRERYEELSFQFRCPKCQNQNVADSNAPISQDIRHKTYEMLHQGFSDQEIIDFMIDRYTEFVIYKPQMSIVTIWLWIVPAFLLISGLTLLLRLTRSTRQGVPTELTAQEQQRLKALIEDKS
ncbi:cytochrome c-type biogenesis protein [Reinekea sp.]|jgi:cytochrome c-type biogenesis protein CcmH|uniref:cytochrome c-type biogenesis protein n=1 Tax=Reinekea sp. TaxID=1970455 RepID=UPI002A82676F|nr:cytochrome c-type biogenesis protein [Reinekea sp.]